MRPVELSVVIITHQEEKRLPRCLSSLKRRWRNIVIREIFVVDSGSTDRTRTIARRFGAKVFQRPFRGYADQKNWAFRKCRSPWILSLDADEALSEELREELEDVLPATPKETCAYAFPRASFFLGRRIRGAGWWPDFQVRLFRRGKAFFNTRRVHEALIVQGGVRKLKNPLYHWTYETIAQYVEKMNRYSGLAAMEIVEKKRKHLEAHALFRPVWIFFRMYVLKRGFIDGREGLVLCLLSAWHEWFKYAKAVEKTACS